MIRRLFDAFQILTGRRVAVDVALLERLRLVINQIDPLMSTPINTEAEAAEAAEAASYLQALLTFLGGLPEKFSRWKTTIDELKASAIQAADDRARAEAVSAELKAGGDTLEALIKQAAAAQAAAAAAMPADPADPVNPNPPTDETGTGTDTGTGTEPETGTVEETSETDAPDAPTGTGENEAPETPAPAGTEG